MIAYIGTITNTRRLNLQLININTKILPIIVNKFLNINVILLLAADFAWLISVPNLLFNYPLLYFSKKYISLVTKLLNTSNLNDIAIFYWRFCVIIIRK